MASKAFDNAQKAMDAATEARLAYLVMQDALQLQERAVVEGVTAYNRKPVQRERPNERFLHRTIKSVEFANRRSQEDEMWHRRQLQLEREERHGRQRSARRQRAHGNTSGTDLDDEELARDAKQRRLQHRNEAASSGSACSSDDDAREPSPQGGHTAGAAAMHASESDSHVAELLTKRTPRGRGSIGSRVDEAGPYLPRPAGAPFLDDTDLDRSRPAGAQATARLQAGPERPAWLPERSDSSSAGSGSSEDDKSNKPQTHRSSSKKRQRASVETSDKAARRKKSSKSKKQKQKHKHRKKKRHKESSE